jgi:hypothetical protein
MKTRNQSFTSRLPVAADEPNFSGPGPFAALGDRRAIRIAGLIGALCLGLMLGLVFNTGVGALSAVLIGVGGAVMAAACVLAEWK